MKLSDIRHMSRDDVLAPLGLQTRHSAVDYLLPALGVFGAGVILGAGLALLLAPKSGRELREDIRNHLPGTGAEEPEVAEAFGQAVGAQAR